jgi:hypothetical protein
MRLLLIAACVAGTSCVIVPAGPSCTDGIQNGTESDIDCGGMCGTCGYGDHCVVDGDCTSAYCAGSVCIAAYSIDNGTGIVVSPGTQAGFGITANTGGSYRIVWTGDASASLTYREFQGTIFTEGTFSGVNPGCAGTCPLGGGDDTVSAPQAVTGGTQITFDSITTTGLEGFDFVASKEPVQFDLLIDGERHPELVFFGSGGSGISPATDPFALSTQ